jgi:hypothetical protein
MEPSLDTSGVGSDGNEDACRHCGLIGQLVLCDNCPAAWHVRCVLKLDPAAAMGVLEQSAAWFCPDCGGLDDRKRQRTGEAAGDAAEAIDDRRVLLCDSERRLYLLATDDEKPKDIARILRIDALELLQFNKPRLHGVRGSSALPADTVVFVPEEAVRQVAHKFNVLDDSDAHCLFVPGLPPRDRLPGPNVFVAEKIMGHRSKPKEEFLVKWEGFAEADATWEPRVNILSARLIVEFERHRRANAASQAAGPLGPSFECVVKRKEGQLGFALVGLSDAATGECWCVVSRCGEGGSLPEGLAAGDVIVAVDGRSVTHQSFDTTLGLLLHAKTAVSLTVHKTQPAIRTPPH